MHLNYDEQDNNFLFKKSMHINLNRGKTPRVQRQVKNVCNHFIVLLIENHEN